MDTMETYTEIPAGSVQLLPHLGRIDYLDVPNPFAQRLALVRAYLMSLDSDCLLRAHRFEAGLFAPGAPAPTTAWHGGWEALDSQLRGHFLGHWLSAAARLCATAADGDPVLRARVDDVIAQLALLQRENGGTWVFSIPEKYLHRIAAGRPVWAPHYTVHKTLMGLMDAHRLLGSQVALDIVVRAAPWFHRFTDDLDRTALDDLLDHETGGMLEVWADLYAATGDRTHLDLVRRYDRPRLFEPLLAGEDPLTNRHANTTIPEVLGAARAFEATGDERWRRVVEAYWRCAVTGRGRFATGGQTSEEVWTPPHEFAARLGTRTQEHCVVHHMVRLAHTLLRWTGDLAYADHIERTVHNGVLAQQHPRTGMPAYYLPLRPGSVKKWGTPTDSFWCCHGTMVQAHTLHTAHAWYVHGDGSGLLLAQYVPSTVRCELRGVRVELEQRPDTGIGSHIAAGGASGAVRRPARWAVEVVVRARRPVEFTLGLRVPEWVTGPVTVEVDGVPQPVPDGPGLVQVRRSWHRQTVRISLPTGLRAEALADRPDTVAFLDGPVVLAGLCDEERELVGDVTRPESFLAPDEEREPFRWSGAWRARGQSAGLRFIPLHEVTDERFAVYFPVRPAPLTHRDPTPPAP
ncbi:beta-L-arabinofuranosidase domain-containing protein [Streptomyces sp. NPDC050400]|uniref:beta-L-arabinofuranosidase domain-containing protein n=1 Tax=Streptomyces sp. NPDC050400 TaxID=3365610 RepID=UPI003798D49A